MRALGILFLAATLALQMGVAPAFGQQAVTREVSLQVANREVNLDDVIEIALAKSPRLRATERGADEAGKAIGAAEGRLWPRLDAFSDYQFSGFDRRNDTRLFANIGRMPRLGPGIPGNRPIAGVPFGTREFDENLFASGVRLSYPLYAGGRLVAGVEAARLAALLAQDRVTLTRDELIFNLSSTYYNILRTEENVQATEASVKALEEARRVIQDLVAVGRVPNVDLLKVNTRLAAVRQDLVRVKNEFELSHVLLNTLMGIDVTQRLKIRGPLDYQPQILDLQKSVAQAEERRPELRILRNEIAIQEQKLRMAKGERLPTVELRSQYVGGTGARQFFPVTDDFAAGVNVSVPIFTGGIISSRIAEESIKLERLQSVFEQARLDVIREVSGAHLNIAEAEERIKTARAALEEAREALRIEELKTQVGKGIIEDLLDAQAAELQAETNVTRALADYNTSLVALRKAIGRVR